MSMMDMDDVGNVRGLFKHVQMISKHIMVLTEVMAMEHMQQMGFPSKLRIQSKGHFLAAR